MRGASGNVLGHRASPDRKKWIVQFDGPIHQPDKDRLAALGVRIGDCLCGTKLVARRDYERMQRWRADFGDFDPFGDFELLFPAAVLGIGIIDVPIRYRARTYGTTNISRFRHGLMLLWMTLYGFFRIKTGRLR